MARADWLQPDWPAPANVKALMTTRSGGVSKAPYDGFNVGDHVGDDPACVATNRRQLESASGAQPVWLTQVHGTEVVAAEKSSSGVVADACVSRTPGHACAVMTADCLPVLLCSKDGSVVGAAHAGWRGLRDGVIEATIDAMGVPGIHLHAWLGAAIGPDAFEVGDDVRQAFLAHDPHLGGAFSPGLREGKWMANLYAIARERLAARGVVSVTGGDLCTYGDAERFYSYRRDGVTGRMVAMIWLSAPPNA